MCDYKYNDRTENAKVLIINHNKFDLKNNGVNLLEKGIETVSVDSVDKAVSHINRLGTDIVLMDDKWPGGTGSDMFFKLKERADMGNIPVVLLSDEIKADDCNRICGNGIVDIIDKPHTSAKIIARIKTHILNKKLRDEVEKEKKKLEKLNREKNEFLGMTAHDMKNPVYNIAMLAKLLRDEDLEREEIREFAQDLVDTSDRMLELITSLVDLNRIEQGLVRLNPEVIDAMLIIRQAVDAYAERAKEKNIDIHFETDMKHLIMITDRNAFMQILDNLVSNAIKYSPPGKNVYLKLSESSEKIRFEVRDEGPGISEADQKQLFKKFAKLSAKPTGDESSTGLGLSIVQRYADLIKAKVWCESEPGKGANFILESPKKIMES